MPHGNGDGRRVFFAPSRFKARLFRGNARRIFRPCPHLLTAPDEQDRRDLAQPALHEQVRRGRRAVVKAPVDLIVHDAQVRHELGHPVPAARQELAPQELAPQDPQIRVLAAHVQAGQKGVHVATHEPIPASSAPGRHRGR